MHQGWGGMGPHDGERKTVCVLIHMEVTVKHMEMVAELNLQRLLSPKFSEINSVFTIQGLGGLRVLFFFPLLAHV